uniref:Uncharacterized protein n=1 Tax=Medicago truncatula TaxID=3880 RepID=I3SAT3_MEDTR|nr:unknown [Medicago truncatula]
MEVMRKKRKIVVYGSILCCVKYVFVAII